MNDVMTTAVPPLLDTPVARRALALVCETESTATANHSVRSALFARLRADDQGAKPGRDYDPELLFLACVLHDIGLTRAGDRHQRFEVDGADTAAEFLTVQGLPTADVDATPGRLLPPGTGRCWSTRLPSSSPLPTRRPGASNSVVDSTCMPPASLCDAAASGIGPFWWDTSTPSSGQSTVGGA
ncbi:HD domain-containing protein [Streptomyces sp. NPDC051740]|uniref:HD domain-containing protein n=1 Tax=Streptomyces sp. NPDC051740 TaxID=3365673 RepID=UPI003793B6C3